jgi:Ca-activated chloride channel family protein
VIEWGQPWAWALVPVVLLAPLAQRPGRLPVADLSAWRSAFSLRVLAAPLPGLLGVLGLLCCVVALARPQKVERERIRTQDGADILLVLDTSGSMETDDYKLRGRSVSRLEVAREVIARFIEGRPDDRIGLVVFGEEAFTQVPLTLDHRSLQDFLAQVRPGMAGKRATAVGDGLAVAVKRLKELEAPTRIVVLLTDGRSNHGQMQPLEAAEAARALGVRVHTIGVGTAGAGGGFFGLFGGGSDLDERTLTRVAERTGGLYFRADDTTALEKTWATIDEMEKSPAEAFEVTRTDERFAPWLIAGLVLLGLQVLLGDTVLRRLP